MKKTAFAFIIVFVNWSVVFGQASSEPISVRKVWGANEYYQGPHILAMNDLVYFMSGNEQAYQLIKSAKANHVTASVFSYASGFFIGWPIGTALGNGDPNWALAGIGAGLFLVAIPFNRNAHKKARQAVDLYNEGIGFSSVREKPEWSLSMTGNGIGLTLSF